MTDSNHKWLQMSLQNRARVDWVQLSMKARLEHRTGRTETPELNSRFRYDLKELASLASVGVYSYRSVVFASSGLDETSWEALPCRLG
jgi:hypothetical protein